MIEHSHYDLETFRLEEFDSEDELFDFSLSNENSYSTLLADKNSEYIDEELNHVRTVGSKRKIMGSQKPLTKRRKKKVKTIVQLPSAVRSTLFAHFMLGERFKMRSERESYKSPEFMIYNFPRFNRSDALVYFPSTFVTFINNGDLSAMSDLFGSFFHRNCAVQIPETPLMGDAGPASRFLEFQQLMNDLHPDQILCMHSTKEVDNEIRADVYFKLIENKVIYESISRTNRRDSHFAPLLVSSRAEHLKTKFDLSSNTEEELNTLTELLDSGVDVEIFGRIDMRLVFNKHSKRVLELKMIVSMTDFHPVTID